MGEKILGRESLQNGEVPIPLEEFDILPRELQSYWRIGISVMAITLSGFQLYTSWAGAFPDYIQRSMHLALAFPIAFALYPPAKKSQQRNKILKIDLLLMSIAVIACLWITFNYERIVRNIGESTGMDIFLGALLILVILEGGRRILGWALPIIAITTMVYAYSGPYLPGHWAHRGFQITALVEHLYLGPNGIWGLITGISASVIAAFLIFGIFLSLLGGGQTFVDLAVIIAGRAHGGPAKVSCFSSAFFGTISGSAVANVVVDGVFNIPLMKKLGYKPHFAAAVEATTSTGGQIMPPVMGAGAFIMAEFINIPYSTIALAAVIPALLYYWGCWFAIHFEAQRLNLKRVPEEQIPRFREVLPRLTPLVLPVAVLLYFLAKGASPAPAAFWAVVTSILLALGTARTKEQFKKSIQKIIKAMDDGGKAVVLVAVLCACAQIVVGMFNATGLGIRISEMIMLLSHENFFLSLFFTMAVCLVLGMGIPTTAAYVLAASVCAPALYKLGIEPLNAHLFIFYFAIISAITPPVCAAVYAAAAIAGSNWWKTGWVAVRLGLSGFIIPYMFIYGPGIILKDNLFNIIWTSFTASIGVIFLSAGVMGFFKKKTTVMERLFLITAGALLIKPGIYSDMAGFIIGGIIYTRQRFYRQNL